LTVPKPDPSLSRVSVCGLTIALPGSEKTAVVVSFVFIVTTQVVDVLPLQSPPSHLTKVPVVGLAISSTAAPSGICATACVQVVAHLIPFGLEATEPLPL